MTKNLLRSAALAVSACLAAPMALAAGGPLLEKEIDVPRTTRIPLDLTWEKCVLVDVCKPHGALLDRGELTRIVDYVEKCGWERVKKREILRMEEDLAALESRKRAGEGLGPPVASESGSSLLKVIGFLSDLFL